MRMRYTYSIEPIVNFISNKFGQVLKDEVNEILREEVELLSTRIPFPFSYTADCSSYYGTKYVMLGAVLIEINGSPFPVKEDDFFRLVREKFPEKESSIKELLDKIIWLEGLVNQQFNNKTELIIEYPWITNYWKANLNLQDARGYVKRISKENSNKLYELLQTAIFLSGGGTFKYDPKGYSFFMTSQQ